jgi:hypothetical protein
MVMAARVDGKRRYLTVYSYVAANVIIMLAAAAKQQKGNSTCLSQKDKAARSIDTAASLQLLLLLPCHPSPFFSSNRCTRFFFNASSSSPIICAIPPVSFELHIGYIIASIESCWFCSSFALFACW